MNKSARTGDPAALERERLRRSYRPSRVRLLFIGEAPPASGRFFYAANSGLYRAIRQAFIAALPDLVSADFLESFRSLECYLIDLCRTPVDCLATKRRREVCVAGEIRLSHTIAQLRPEIIVTVVRSIAANVERALPLANWEGTHLELPYPGRWRHHQIAFEKALIPILKKEFARGQKPLAKKGILNDNRML